eukprot:gene10221-2641_t
MDTWKLFDDKNTGRLLLPNIEENRESIEIMDVQFQKKLKSYERRINILKFLSSNFIVLIGVFLLFLATILILAITNTAIEIATPNFCTFHTFDLAPTITGIIPFVLYGILVFYVFIAILVDLITFTCRNGCSPIEYFVNDDALGFRFQIYLNCVTSFIYWLFTSYFFYSYFIPTNNENTWDKYTTMSLFILGQFGYLSLYGGVPPLLIVLFQKIIKCTRSTKYDSEFEALINDKKGKEIFKKYAKAEWSLENILFYEDVQTYLNSPTIKYAKRRSTEILNNYIELGSTLEVNISADVRKPLLNKLKNFDDNSDQYLFIFDKSLQEVKRNMRDTFSRIPGSEFKSWIATKVKKDERELQTLN